MARVFREADGTWSAQLDTGEKVRLPESIVHEITPHDIVQEQGVTNSERFQIKNFATNVGSARQWLEQRGYETRPLNTSGLNFAVRRTGTQGPWKVLDPEGFAGGRDFLMDMADLTSDGILAASAAFSGGVTGAAIASGGGELVKEAIGSQLGFQNNISPTEVGLQTVAGAAAPLVGRAVGAAGRAIANSAPGRATGNFLLETGAKIAGVKALSTEAGLLSPGQVLRQRAQLGSISSARQLASELIGKVKLARAEPMGERLRLNGLLKRGSQDGLTVDLRDSLDALEGATTTPAAEAPGTGGFRQKAQTAEAAYARQREPDLPERARAQISNIYQTIADAQGIRVADVDLSKVPVDVADRVQAGVRDTIDTLRGYTKTERSLSRPQLVRRLNQTATDMREALEGVMNPYGGNIKLNQAGRTIDTPKFSYLYSALDKKMNALNNLSRAVGADTSRNGSIEKAITYIRATAGDKGPEALRDFERQFGSVSRGGVNVGRGVEDAAHTVNVGEAFGGRNSQGVPGSFARLTAFGQPIGAGLVGAALGGSLGAYEGGKPGAVAGSLAGFMAFSPKAVLGATRLGLNGVGIPRYLARAARLTATASLQMTTRSNSAGSNTVASDTNSRAPLRKAYFTGQ